MSVLRHTRGSPARLGTAWFDAARERSSQARSTGPGCAAGQRADGAALSGEGSSAFVRSGSA